MNSRQDALAQFETPLDVAELLLGFAVRRPADRVLDPSCGEGQLLDRAAAWLRWLSAAPRDPAPGLLFGVELDPLAAEQAGRRVPAARISNRNFLTLDPEALPEMDAIAGNPPYTRAERIGALQVDQARQLAMFPQVDTATDPDKIPLILHKLSSVLSGRSGLHAYFLVHSTAFLTEGGRLAFVMPNGWLDVAYGAELKQYLLDHYRVLAIVESSVERWFEEAWINTCIVVLQKCANLSRRQGNLVNLVRLKQPLQQLLPFSAGDPQRFVAVERLVRQLLPGQSVSNDVADIHAAEQPTLRAEDKWGMGLRTPPILRQHRDHLNLIPLRTWATVQRGYTTGANEFFYLTAETIEEWGIEEQFRRPLFKSLRGIDHLMVTPQQSRLQVLLIPPEANLEGTAVARYLEWGEAQQIHQRRTCANRDPWYSLPLQPPAHLVLPKGIWHRHFAPLLVGEMAVDQQLYQIYLAGYLPLTAVAALLNSAWFALQVELRGRVSFGKGLLWLAAYELEEVLLPDPRQMLPDQVQRLEETFNHLSRRPLAGTFEELTRPDRCALDEAVFDLLRFRAQERADTLKSLAERLASRQQRAR